MEEPVTRADIQAASDPTPAVTGCLIVIGGRMIGFPGCRSTTPVAEAPALQTKLHSIFRAIHRGLIRKVKGNVLFKKPMTVWPNNVKPRTMRGGKPMMINNAARNNLMKAIGGGPPMRGGTVGLTPKGMRV